MEIIKDKRYGIIYTIATVLEAVILILGIILMVNYFCIFDKFTNIEKGMFGVCVIIIMAISLFGLSLGLRSLYGYLRIPLFLVEANEKIRIHLSKKVFVEVSKDDILEVTKVKERFSRSTYTIQIKTQELTYVLKDVMNLDDKVKEFNAFLGK